MTATKSALVLAFRPLAAAEPDAWQSGLFSSSASRWVGQEPEPTRWVIDKLVPEGCVTLLTAAGGRGKSYLTVQAMACVAAGVPFLGFNTTPGVAAGLFSEDDDNELHLRLKAICRKLDINFDTTAAGLFPVSTVGRSAVLWRGGKRTELLDAIEADFERQPNIKLWIIDSASEVFDGKEENRGEVTRFLSELTGISMRHNLATLLIAHESKSTKQGSDTHATSGSTAWLNRCRSVMGLYLDKKDSAIRTLRHVKSNKGPLVSPLTCRFNDGFEVLGDAHRQRECWEFTEQTVRAALARGTRLSPKSRARNFAGKYVHEQQAGTNFSLEEIKAALSNLEDFIISIETYVEKGEEHSRYVFSEGILQPEDDA